MNPSGKRRPKRRHHGEGTVVRRKDHWRAKPWTAVVPYTDAGRKRTTWLSAASRDEGNRVLGAGVRLRDEVGHSAWGQLWGQLSVRERDEFTALLVDLRPGEIWRELGRRGIRIEGTHGGETVGQFVTAWLDTLDVGPGSWPRYRQHVTERILPSFGDTPLADLAPQAVRRALLGWEGSPQTRGAALRLLRAAMKQAVADRRIEHDPTAGIPYPRIPRHEPVTLDADQARLLMDTVKGERFAPILVLSLGLGVRRGEALGLRTQDINWEADDESSDGQTDDTGRMGGIPERDAPGGPRVRRSDQPHSAGLRGVRTGVGRPASVTISKSLRFISPRFRAEKEGPYRLTGTKTGETRIIPLPAFVAESLRVRLEERDREQRAAKVYAPNDFVFCDPSGNSIPLETLRRWFLGALKRAKLPPMRWHDLRGTTVTLLYELDVPEAVIMAIVGHRSLATTRLYKGKTPQATKRAAERLDGAMGGTG